MKKLFLLLLVLLAVGAWLGQKMVEDSGYVLLAYKNTTIETSIWVMLFVLVVLFFALHGTLNLINRGRKRSWKFTAWREHRNQRISRRKTLKGLTALAQGNWAQAQKQLVQAAERSDLPLINYLAAAKASHEQNNEVATDELLQKARSSTPEAEVTVAISQAEIQLARGQLEPSLATLLRLRSLAPKNTYVMKLLKDVYVRLSDWSALSDLLPVLRKNQALPEEQIRSLELQCYTKQLESAAASSGIDPETQLKTLGRVWHSIPLERARDIELVQRYTELLIKLGAEGRAEQNLRDLIKRHWDEKLVSLYGRVQGEYPQKQLQHADQWQRRHPDSPALLLTLGRLCMRNQKWQEAVQYFEQSLALEPSRDALAELVRLLRHLGEQSRAQTLLEQHMQLIANDLPMLPMPEEADLAAKVS
ncbi:heme biosynthesis HemY N-terminal domain-containing protein [Neptuniibacter sp. CAU 1671]|uniref:heme biosynthesis HemY N-terminal domain-containing protein n=1 Tax=Neptuniibacter sp. CAU 1671 TaxID=3032593 RepID=UPI0023DA7D1A|nr:heme biosynthesis HemY N-terminal domain-containing protein [Neptuniibacter sp. CAU 1671]MDF2182634.1 heme biosynthesis HemY N-terminal domain-containing protein [Neptuniibacter sp. CAU 1671]